MSKLISVIGSPNSGKTTVSVALARRLAAMKNNVCIICCDQVVPTIPAILPQSTNNVNDPSSKIHSIGKVLSNIDFSPNDILAQSAYSKIDKIILIGYAYGENRLSYPAPTEYDAYNLYSKISEMVDYVIIDCGNDLSSPLVKVGIEHSDYVLRLAGSTYKDIVYYASNIDLIPEGETSKKDHIIIHPKYKRKDNIDFVSDFYGGVDYYLSYDPNIEKMMEYGEYFVKAFPAKYNKELDKILNDVCFA